MVKAWFRTKEGRKALAAGFVVALAVLTIETIRFLVSLIIDIIYYRGNIEVAIDSYSYIISLAIGSILLVYFIQRCDWKD